MTKDESTGGPRSVVAADIAGRDRARPSRKTPAHHPIREESNRSSIVFLTVSTQDKRPLLAQADVHELLTAAWRQADAWHVGRYVIMPNHIHLFCAPGCHEYPALSRWVHFWKSFASRRWPRPGEHPIWQKSFWDTQLRRGENYAEKWKYVRCNPVRAGLCATAEEWPLQGELNVLMWHD
jgi:putative transposase